MNGLERLLELIKCKDVSTIILQKKDFMSYSNLFAEWSVYTGFDRRSIAYYAMGVSQEKKEPVMILVSDTEDAALSDMLPGITEAFYQNVPLFILVLNSQESWLTNSENVIGDKCLFSCSITETEKGFLENDICNLNYALSLLTKYGGGPVIVFCNDINCTRSVCKLPIIDFVSSDQFLKNKSIFIDDLKKQPIHLVLDSSDKYSMEDIKALKIFCNQFNASISRDDIYYATRYLPVKDGYEQSLILSFGDNHAYLIDYKNYAHWIVSPQSYLNKISCKHIQVDWRVFISALSYKENEYENDDNSFEIKTYNDSWNVQNIVFRIISNIKEATWVTGFSVRNIDISTVFSTNKYVNSASFMDSTGGEGVLSIFIGQAIASKSYMCICFVDEERFFRDMNALHIQAITKNVRIVLFCSADGVKQSTAWASSCGFKCMTAKNYTELGESLEEFCTNDVACQQLLAIII